MEKSVIVHNGKEIKQELNETIQVEHEFDSKLPDRDFLECGPISTLECLTLDEDWNSNDKCDNRPSKIHTMQTTNPVEEIKDTIQAKTEYDSEKENEYRKCINKQLLDLYEDHIIKDELVIGPEIIQRTYTSTDFIENNESNMKTQYQCDLCEKKYVKKICLQHHIVTKHMNLKSNTKCVFCNKTFYRIKNRNVHMKHCSKNKYKTNIHKTVNPKSNKPNKHTHLKCSTSIEKNKISAKVQCPLCKKQISVKTQGNHIRYYCLKNINKTNSHKPCHFCNKIFYNCASKQRHLKYACPMNDKKNRAVVQCPHCKKEVCNANLYIHMRYNCRLNKTKINRETPCHLCNKMFSNRNHKDRHLIYSCPMNKNKITAKVKCHLCKKEYKNISTLNRHVRNSCLMNRNETNTANTTCKLCNKIFSGRVARDNHFKYACPMNNKKNSSKLQCNLCNKILGDNNSLNRHVKLYCTMNRHQTNTNIITCKLCNKIFSSIEGRNYHFKYVCPMNDHKINSKLQCHLCKKEFRSKSGQYIHITYCCPLNNNKTNVTCNLCNKILASNTSRSSHLKYSCPMNKKKLAKAKCQYCKKFFSKKSMHQHVKYYCPLNNNKPNIVCHICNKTFSTTRSRDWHVNHNVCTMKKIKEPPDTVCKYCNKVFSSRRCRDRHIIQNCPMNDNSLIQQKTKKNHLIHKNKRKRNIDQTHVKGSMSKEQPLETQFESKSEEYELKLPSPQEWADVIGVTGPQDIVIPSSSGDLRAFAMSPPTYYECDHCRKLFKSKSGLKCHVMNHMAPK